MRGLLFRYGHALSAVVIFGSLALAPDPVGDSRQAALSSTPGNVLASTATPAPTLTPAPIATPTPAPAAPRTAVRRTTPKATATVTLAGKSLYTDPNTSARRQAATWQASRPADAAAMTRMANQPQARWFGDWQPDPYADTHAYVSAAATAGAWPVLVLYNLPDRDCGGFSAGGAANPAAYLAWIERVATGLGQRPAAIILEPDALAGMDCHNAAQQASITTMLSQAVTILKRDRQAAVYIDAGNSGWKPAATMAPRLRSAGIVQADGFALNVSNFYTTTQSLAYGRQLSGLVGGKHFVIDTSRNGAGSNGQWCNPTGRALGEPPTTSTGQPLADAYLWLKTPGDSDGTCDRGEPRAGTWWPEYALDLAKRAGY